MHQRGEIARENGQIRPVVYGIGLYFLCAGMDSFRIGALGSVLKLVALVPLALAVLDIRSWRFRICPILVAQGLFWMLALASVLYSLDPHRSMSSVQSLTLNLCLVFGLGMMERYNQRELGLMQRAMLLGGWVTVILIVVFSDVSADGRLTLLLGEKNQDQNYLNGYFLYTFSCHCQWLLLEKKRIHLIPVAVILAVVLLTGSRGALIAYLLVFFVHTCMLFSHSKHRLRNIALVLLLIGLFVVGFDWILAQMPPQVAQRYAWDYLARKGTTGRTRIWSFVLDHYCADSMLRMLFGHGYATSMLVNTMNGRIVHNLYLDNLITLGLPGMLLQIALQGAVLRALRKGRDPAMLAAYWGMIGMCISLSLVNYKPIWNIMLMALAIEAQTKRRELPDESDE